MRFAPLAPLAPLVFLVKGILNHQVTKTPRIQCHPSGSAQQSLNGGDLKTLISIKKSGCPHKAGMTVDIVFTTEMNGF
jgi:hypothetical protein